MSDVPSNRPTDTADVRGAMTGPQAVAAKTSAAMATRDAAGQLLGIAVVDVAPGLATVRMFVRPDMVNSHGTCHGGIIFTLADTAFAHACNSHGPPAVAASASIDFLRPAPAGATLTAMAVEQFHRGRTGLYDVVVTAGDESDPVARFHGRSHHPRPP